METDINVKLYNMAVRQSIYLERFKLGQGKMFNKFLLELKDNFNKLLYRSKYKTLDALTKVELNKLLVELRQSQLSIYNNYTSELIAMLQAFMKADVQIAKLGMTSILSNEESDDDYSNQYIEENKESNSLFGIAWLTSNNYDSLWSSINNKPIGIDGQLPPVLISGFVAASASAFENLLRLGYTNGLTPDEVSGLAFDLENAYGNVGVSKKIFNNSKALSETLITNVHVLSTAGVASVLFSAYIWHSIIDGRTSNICRSRNNNVYEYGKGPLPPAHNWCRSIILSVYGAFNGDSLPGSLYSWVVSQPDDVIADMFNASELSELKETGKLTLADTLSLSEYRNKLNNLLK